jgi:dienelactone hydrolase
LGLSNRGALYDNDYPAMMPIWEPTVIRSLAMLTVFVSLIFGQAPKKPLTHADYEIWNSITGMTLSPDGRFVAYTLSPVKGDAAVIVRNVESGVEWKFAKGGSIAASTPTPGGDDDLDDQPPATPSVTPPATPSPSTTPSPRSIAGGPTFTPDSRFLYVVLTATKAETDKAVAEKKNPDEMPKPVLAVVNLSSGKIVERITEITAFRIVGKDAGMLIMTKAAKPEKATAEKPVETAPPPKKAEAKPVKPSDEADAADQEVKKEGESSSAPVRTGNELRVRNLADNSEVKYSDVLEYVLSRDATQMVYSIAGKAAETNGVAYSDLMSPAKAVRIVTGAGRFYRLTWDDKQSMLAFFHDDAPPAKTDTAAKTEPTAGPPSRFGKSLRGPSGSASPTIPTVSQVKPKVYLWERPAKEQPAKPAVMILGPETIGLPKGWQFVDRGGLNFTADGMKLTLSIAPEPEKPSEVKKTASVNPTDKVEMDLWHYKDAELQPMQKIRAAAKRNRSFSAAYFLDSKKFVPLADEDRDLRAPEFGDWGVGRSDLKYRHMTWESPTPADYTLVNVRNGETKALLTAAKSSLVMSPHGKALAGFDGKHWFAISIPDGRKTMLTAKLKTSFFNDEFDMPMIAPSYGFVGFSSDDRFVYVSDKHDIWRLAVDGGEATNITAIGAKSNLRFRLIRVEKPENDDDAERDVGLNPSLPWLLAAENLITHDTGFYRVMPGKTPSLLIMGAKAYGTPTKAKRAETMILTASTFSDDPDYYITNTSFDELKRITEANPHKRNYNWARAEIVDYTNTDGDKLQAILVKPENFDPSKKYPMIVYLYERLSNTYHTYREPNVRRGQVINPTWYASNGYLVLMPDIKYKVGYPGQSALNCVLPAIQTVVNRGCVNEKAIGINGQSWGGYQIAYMITQTNRFKAAVAGAAVSNMTSAYNGIRWGSGMARQFQYERTQSRIGETLWQAPMKYLENSPVFAADRVTTPLMMIHNDADDAVPWYQGIEYYLSLRRLGKEVYMLNYNNEAHNLTKTANARDFAVRMHQFFEHHLKGQPIPPWMAKGVPYLNRDQEKDEVKKLLAPVGK